MVGAEQAPAATFCGGLLKASCVGGPGSTDSSCVASVSVVEWAVTSSGPATVAWK